MFWKFAKRIKKRGKIRFKIQPDNRIVNKNWSEYLAFSVKKKKTGLGT